MAASSDMNSIRKKLESYRETLIKSAHDDSCPIDPVDRLHIIDYLEKGLLPKKPASQEQLLKEFVSSALSINQPPFRIRSRLRKVLGEIVLGNSVALCLSQLFDTNDFLDDRNWRPQALGVLVETIKEGEQDKFKQHILRTMGSISVVMGRELAGGINAFYGCIDEKVKGGAETTWTFMQDFTHEIWGVGPVLMSDFLKNVGFPYFVKIDVHLKKEFPGLVAEGMKDSKSMFINAWRLCEKLEMTPFVFDHILYQRGRMNRPSSMMFQQPCL